MQNFKYSIPTTVYFGEDQISHLAELKESGKKVLLCYGGGSIKKNGIYDKAMSILTKNGMEVYELSGIEPNPHVETVRKGVRIAKEKGIDMVLAIGGGSTIDCAKMVAAGAVSELDAWELSAHKNLVTKALPIYCVLTLAATGSEMDVNAVISNPETHEKVGGGAPAMLPKMSILDPTYSFSVSRKQTAAGTADIMSHTFESYFTNVPGADLQAGFAEAILKTCIQCGPVALEEPENYDARANLMWAGSFAINGLLSLGCPCKWNVHPIEHELSAFYDAVHGEGLAILTPVWMRYVLEKDRTKLPKFAAYGRNVWNIQGKDDETTAYEAIGKTEEFFFVTMKMPKNLRAIGIPDASLFERMAEKAEAGCYDGYYKLSKKDILEIYKRAF